MDLFSGYIQLCPFKDKTADSLIEAIENTIVRAFGPLKFLRSDQETGLAQIFSIPSNHENKILSNLSAEIVEMTFRSRFRSRFQN